MSRCLLSRLSRHLRGEKEEEQFIQNVRQLWVDGNTRLQDFPPMITEASASSWIRSNINLSIPVKNVLCRKFRSTNIQRSVVQIRALGGRKARTLQFA